MLNRVSGIPSISCAPLVASSVNPLQIYVHLALCLRKQSFSSDPFVIQLPGELQHLRERTMELFEELKTNDARIPRAPLPPDNEQIRLKNPKLYCSQWDKFYEDKQACERTLWTIREGVERRRRELLEELRGIGVSIANTTEWRQAIAEPRLVNATDSAPFRYMYYEKAIWQTDRDLDIAQMTELANFQIRREEGKLVAAFSSLSPKSRQAIPAEVKIFVWQRDRGCCVHCGSSRDLEFDHIIPLSIGGANTARNLQLLCESCNRSKGKAIL